MPIFKPITPVLDKTNSIASGLIFDDPLYLNNGGIITTDLVNANTGNFLGSTKPSWIMDTAVGLGAGLSFNGTTAYIDYTDISAYDLTGSAISIESWFIWPSGASVNQLICKPVNAASHTSPFFSYALMAISGTDCRLWLNLSSGSANTDTGVMSFTVGNLYQIVATYDGSNMRIYQNAVIKQTKGATGTINSFATPIRVGANGGLGELWNGKMFINRVWNRKLADTEIELLYENPFRIYLPIQTNNHQFVKVGNGMSTGERIR
jgi:hypothetical protein